LFQAAEAPAAPPPRQPSDAAGALAAGQQPAAAVLADTVELRLPIFEEVKSRWFTTAPASTLAGDAVSSGPAPAPADGWQTAADTGWQAAAAAAEPAVAEKTANGLPKRRPMAHLVPGSVETDRTSAPAVEYRDAQAVGATLAAYGRGLARSRTGPHIRPTTTV
jgi:hypothetical protein